MNIGYYIKCARFLLPLSLFISPLLLAQSNDELIEKAKGNDVAAQLELANIYEAENKVKQAHFWYITAAIKGEPSALTALGRLFESQKEHSINPLNFAENWYLLGLENNNPDAEEAYSRVLEALFNQRRAKQVSSITVLDEAIDLDIINAESPAPDSLSSEKKIGIDIIVISLVILVMIIFVSVRRALRQRKHSANNKIELTVSEQAKKIKSLNRHLNKAHEQIKRQQQMNQINATEQNLTIACAILGFKPSQIPSEKELKLRYKKLSRIYHPDTSGSDEEMKRLNASIKTVITHLQKNK